MYLTDLLTDLVRRGVPPETMSEIQLDLFEKFPEAEGDIFSRSMSAAMADPEIPDDYAKKIISGAGGRAYKTNPAFGIVTESEKTDIAKKVLSLLPSDSDAQDAKEAAQIKKKREKVEATILKAKDLGISIPTGNIKMGEINNWSLPAGNNFRRGACPGASETCESLCYAKDALFAMNEWRYYCNWAYILLWPDRFVDVWSKIKVSGVVRVHVGGDFFSPEYVDLWNDIVKRRSGIRFYAYTRSWQDGKGKIQEKFLPALEIFAAAKNSRLLLSCDKDTGVPPDDLLSNALRAWLAVDDNDVAKDGSPDLCFRDSDGMKATLAEMGGAPVCPIERSPNYIKVSGKLSCQDCGFCYSSGFVLKGIREDDVHRFDAFAGLDLEERTKQMFHSTADPKPRPNPDDESEEEDDDDPDVDYCDCEDECDKHEQCPDCGMCKGCCCECDDEE
jgi:hypothetical protein